MPFLELKGVEKQFGDVKTIKGVDLAIERGQFTVFVGPSGCGKSTLLRLIAGLETLTAGSIHLDGREITRLPSAQRDLAMVFQSYALYPHMTVRENMAFSLKLRRADAARTDQRVLDAARICTRSLASRFDSGSSNRKTCGLRTMARPMATRWRWPPERCLGKRLR